MKKKAVDSDPSRVLFRQMLGATAQFDRSMTVLKFRAARKRVKASTGRCEGRKPFGELPAEAALVERMSALRTQGMTFDRNSGGV